MINKTKICYIIPSFDTATGSHFFHLYEFLECAGKELDIFLVAERSRGIPRAFLPRCYRQRFSWAPLRAAELFFVLLYARFLGCRFFYTHYSFVGAFFAWLVTRMFGGMNFYWNCGMPWLYRRGFVEETVFRFILRHSILVTGTIGLSGEYRRRYALRADRIRVVPNWIKVGRFKNTAARKVLRQAFGIADDAKVVLFVHRLSRRKGAHYILPAVRAVTEKLKNVIFLIVGSGPELESLKLKVKSLKLDESVRLAGEVPNSKISDYFAAADVFFMPSEEEGFPHVLLEAMAAGLPYAASDVGGVREITPPEMQEYVLQKGDVGAFSDKISKLLEMSYSERENIIQAAGGWVKQYDLKEALPKFIELFEKP